MVSWVIRSTGAVARCGRSGQAGGDLGSRCGPFGTLPLDEWRGFTNNAHAISQGHMLGFEAIRTTRRRLRAAFLVAMAAVSPPALAHGHFILVAPDPRRSQDCVGLPERLGP